MIEAGPGLYANEAGPLWFAELGEEDEGAGAWLIYGGESVATFKDPELAKRVAAILSACELQLIKEA